MFSSLYSIHYLFTASSEIVKTLVILVTLDTPGKRAQRDSELYTFIAFFISRTGVWSKAST